MQYITQTGKYLFIYFSTQIATRAAAYSHLGMHEQAIEDCNMSISLKPDYGKAYGRLGYKVLYSPNLTIGLGWHIFLLENSKKQQNNIRRLLNSNQIVQASKNLWQQQKENYCLTKYFFL